MLHRKPWLLRGATRLVPQTIPELAFFFDFRDAYDAGVGTIKCKDITGTWELEPTVNDSSITLTTDGNGIQRVTIAGRSDSLQVALTGDGQVPLDSALTWGFGSAYRTNTIDGLCELGVSGSGWSYIRRNNGYTAERARTYNASVAQTTRDVIVPNQAAAETPHHGIIRAPNATTYQHRNAWVESGTASNGAPTGTASVLTVGGSINGPAATYGDGHFYFLYAYKRDIIGADMARLDAWIRAQFKCLGLNKTDA